jgi:hypothetical protein
MVACKECGFDISLKSCEPKEIIECPGCSAPYEVYCDKKGNLAIKESEIPDGMDYGE